VILAWHLVWTAYGWWFPNDPRGAWSQEVWKPSLRGLGKVEWRGRRKVQPTAEELQAWLSGAQKRLKYAAVVLDDGACGIVREAIREQAELHGYVIPALAVPPRHVHVVVEKHAHPYERMVQAFKSVSSRRLRRYLGLTALRGKAAKRVPIWARGYWVRYLDTKEAAESAVRYVNRHITAV